MTSLARAAYDIAPCFWRQVGRRRARPTLLVIAGTCFIRAVWLSSFYEQMLSGWPWASANHGMAEHLSGPGRCLSRGRVYSAAPRPEAFPQGLAVESIGQERRLAVPGLVMRPGSLAPKCHLERPEPEQRIQWSNLRRPRSVDPEPFGQPCWSEHRSAAFTPPALPWKATETCDSALVHPWPYNRRPGYYHVVRIPAFGAELHRPAHPYRQALFGFRERLIEKSWIFPPSGTKSM